jgi:hypothetical protein
MQYTKKYIIDGEAAALQGALRRERIHAMYKSLIYCEKYFDRELILSPFRNPD